MKGLNKAMVIAVLAVVFLSIFPQKIPSQGPFLYCAISFSMQNNDRYCYGDDLFAECGEYWGPFYHDPPFGNWGVDSNLQLRSNDDQFQGWKDKEGWQQWNSCTGKYPWKAPSECNVYYNYNVINGLCWDQWTDTWINNYAGGVTYIEIPRFRWDDG